APVRPRPMRSRVGATTRTSCGATTARASRATRSARPAARSTGRDRSYGLQVELRWIGHAIKEQRVCGGRRRDLVIGGCRKQRRKIGWRPAAARDVEHGPDEKPYHVMEKAV